MDTIINRVRSSISIPTDITIRDDQDANKVFDRDNPKDNESIHSNTSYEFKKINRIEQTSVDPDNIRGQIDTGAKVSCTNMLFLLHEYKPYTRRRPSKIRLTAAISDENSDIGIIPEGEGYLHIPSANTKGYI